MPLLDPDWLRHQQTPNLLALLLQGDAAYRCGDRPLTELFHLAPQPLACREEATPAPLPLLAAKELLARALAESLSARDALDSPQVVRDLLRLRLAHRQNKRTPTLFDRPEKQKDTHVV